MYVFRRTEPWRFVSYRGDAFMVDGGEASEGPKYHS
jgi:hypothetical protein